MAASATTTVTGAADVFALGAVAFELLARRELLPVGHNLAEYESRVHSLTLMDMSGGWVGGRVMRLLLVVLCAAAPACTDGPCCL